jgi:4-aminobutyrate aminotransferase
LSVVAKAEGAYIEDTNGMRYLDFHGNNVHHIGYGHPGLKKAIADQMNDLPFAPRRFACESALALAKSWLRFHRVNFQKYCSQQAVQMQLKLH